MFISEDNNIELNEIKLPINKGDVVGKAIVKDSNKKIREVELTVSEDIKKCNILKLFYKKIKNILCGTIEFV